MSVCEDEELTAFRSVVSGKIEAFREIMCDLPAGDFNAALKAALPGLSREALAEKFATRTNTAETGNRLGSQSEDTHENTTSTDARLTSASIPTSILIPTPGTIPTPVSRTPGSPKKKSKTDEAKEALLLAIFKPAALQGETSKREIEEFPVLRAGNRKGFLASVNRIGQ